ncbi:hypothetical protein FH972_008064 [Carpinus fangiana]|uniref:DUF4220 domain-containing protein n=1 Tax=Carpinus fangiana TaxID=176857 RepID=A0A5N6QYC3_9ROSI|nr:hypothetical protein FH972_008064 [Carpinus fangiana]
MVLLSLILQITLFIFERRRRSSVKSRIIFTVWIAYLAADWLATAAIAKLTEAQADSSNTISPTNQLRALWAPLIFLHLGGPNTITAYAFEDSNALDNIAPWEPAGHIKKRYWSNSMGQFSLLSFCFNHRPGKLSRILEMLGIDKMLRWFWHKRFLVVPPSLKPLIREKLLAKLATNYIELKWSCTGSILVERIITWHIATDICYHDTSFSNMRVVGDNNGAKETSKILSDYMMYLLVMHPSMFLPAHHHKLRLYELDQARNILTQFFDE